MDFIYFCNFLKNSVRTLKTEINKLSDHTELITRIFDIYNIIYVLLYYYNIIYMCVQ